MKRKRPKIIKFHPYFSALVKEGEIQVKDRAISVDAIREIEKFETELKKKNFRFIRKKIGKYYHYWLIFNFLLLF